MIENLYHADWWRTWTSTSGHGHQPAIEDVGVQPGYSPYGIYERMDGVSSSDVCSA